MFLGSTSAAGSFLDFTTFAQIFYKKSLLFEKIFYLQITYNIWKNKGKSKKTLEKKRLLKLMVVDLNQFLTFMVFTNCTSFTKFQQGKR